ncbi:MAG: putative transporter [Flavobacteriaceae bacterium]|jgi:putative transport protein|nr:putative transporter [Flavobacteriaceae bacterium]
MDWLLGLLANHESVAYTVLVYSVVISAGVALGKIKFFGISFGITFVLFMGILVSHFGFGINEHILHFMKEFGLILFVYTIGLQVGPGFFSSFKKEGTTLNLLAILVVLAGIIVTVSIHYITGTPITTMVGIMSGAVTNTPGLGAAQQTVMDLFKSSPTANTDVQTLATGYAIAYPFGVLGIIFSMLILKKVFHVNIEKENRLSHIRHSSQTASLNEITLEVANPSIYGKELRILWLVLKSNFVVSRVLHEGKVISPNKSYLLAEGDLLLILAPTEDLERLESFVGHKSHTDLSQYEEDKNKVVSRRINITKPYAYTKKIGELAVSDRFNVTISKVFRAGVEFIPDRNTKLQFGDTITAIGEEVNIVALARAFGNSKKKLSTPHIAELFLGIILGVLVGSIPFNFPGIPVPVKLGLAGGPLIVAILISRYGGRFSVTHYVSNSANLMVREIGIVMFLASVGLGAGGNFWETLTNGDGWSWMLYGVFITVIPLIVGALIGRFFYKFTFVEICGLLAGASTDPPALAFANQAAGSDAPAITYATVYPLTTFLRIMGAQLILLLFF